MWASELYHLASRYDWAPRLFGDEVARINAVFQKEIDRIECYADLMFPEAAWDDIGLVPNAERDWAAVRKIYERAWEIESQLTNKRRWVNLARMVVKKALSTDLPATPLRAREM